jgi:quinol monooxygenase YgiN
VADGLSAAKRIPAGVNPWILFQEIAYKDGGAISKLLPAWKDVVSAAEQESGTLHFGVYTDPKNATKLFTFEVYQSFDYFIGTHARGEVLAEKNRQTGDLVVSLSGAELGLTGGFLYKG